MQSVNFGQLRIFQFVKRVDVVNGDPVVHIEGFSFNLRPCVALETSLCNNSLSGTSMLQANLYDNSVLSTCQY